MNIPEHSIDVNQIALGLKNKYKDILKKPYAKRYHKNETELVNIALDEGYNALMESSEYDYVAKKMRNSVLYYLYSPSIGNLANKYSHNSNIEYQDMFGAASIGFTKALNTFDEKKETKFLTYSWICMQNELRHVVNYHKQKTETPDTAVNVPSSIDGIVINVSKSSYTKKWKNVDQMYNVKIQRIDNTYQYEIPFLFDLTIAEGDQVKKGDIIGKTILNGSSIGSIDLDTVGQDQSSMDYNDVISNSDNVLAGDELKDDDFINQKVIQNDQISLIKNIVDRMPEFDKLIMYSRNPFLANMSNSKIKTQSELAEEFHTTQPNISRREKKIYKRIKLIIHTMNKLREQQEEV